MNILMRILEAGMVVYIVGILLAAGAVIVVYSVAWCAVGTRAFTTRGLADRGIHPGGRAVTVSRARVSDAISAYRARPRFA